MELRKSCAEGFSECECLLDARCGVKQARTCCRQGYFFTFNLASISSFVRLSKAFMAFFRSCAP